MIRARWRRRRREFRGLAFYLCVILSANGSIRFAGANFLIDAIEISQIFVLTHNALFHHYVTAGYDGLRHYNHFSFFEVKKKNEVSSIIPSLKELNGNIINKNPQKSYYTSLWDAYNEVDSSNAPITLMRQILNSYFIQTCERTEEDTIDDLTIDHADKFIIVSDTSKLELLKLIVAFIDTPSGIFQDDVYSTSSGLDLTECKRMSLKLSLRH